MWERLERREIDRPRPAPPGIAGEQPRPDLPAGTDLLPQIRHIVVLMMENHSYDNYFGLLTGRGEGLPLGPDGVPVAVNYLPDGQAFPAHPMPSTVQVPANPTQTWHASHLQYGDGRCDGFASSVAATVTHADPGVPMGYWTERDLPFYHGLARTFPLADHWFCSCLGPTFPNRRFLISGTAHGLIDDLPWDVVDYPEAGTIFDTLTDHGISWVNYHNVRPVLVLFRRLSHSPPTCTRWVWPGQRRRPGLREVLRGEPAGHRTGRVVRGRGHQPGHARAGLVPHAADLALRRARRVLRPRPAARGPAPDDVPAHNFQLQLPSWLRTLLRPVFGKAFADLVNIDTGPLDYTRYGFRVPAVIVSPYARPGYLCRTTFDHTSVLKLIAQKRNPAPLTRRDAAAASPLQALDLDGEPAFATPPTLPAPTLTWGSWKP